MVQWLRLCTSTAGDMGSIPGRGTKILHAVLSSPPKKSQGEEPKKGNQQGVTSEVAGKPKEGDPRKAVKKVCQRGGNSVESC